MAEYVDERSVRMNFGEDAGYVEIPLEEGDTAWNPKTGGKYHGPCVVIYYQREFGSRIYARRERA